MWSDLVVYESWDNVRKSYDLDVILIFSENEMSTWEDFVVNEPHLSSLPPALASSLVKELQGARGVAKVELQNQWHVFFLDTVSNDQKRNYDPSSSITRARTWQEGKLALVNSEEEVVASIFKVFFIFKVVAPISLFYNGYIQDCYAASLKVIFLLQGGCTDPFSVFTFLAFALAVMDLVMEMNRCVCFCAIKHSFDYRTS